MRATIATAALLGIIAIAAPAAASAADGHGYWTSARMRAAVPIEQLNHAQPDGAGDRGPRLHRQVDRDLIADTTRYPHSTHGKVFGTIPGAGDFVCSGTIVHSESRSLVTTAGHCVYDHEVCGGCWATNWTFVPGYHNGQSPFGRWTATNLQVPPGWVQAGDLSFDVGMATLEIRDGVAAEDAAGARGMAFERPREQTYVAYGYPARAPFDGEKLWTCTSPYGGADSGSPAPMRIACDQTPGSSGGGWVIDNRYVVSVISYGYLLGINDLFGPYFGSEIRTLYEGMGGSADPGSVEILRRPREVTADRTPTFRYTADVFNGEAEFRCRIDARAWKVCASPSTYSLGGGRHVFRVEARDWEGGWIGEPTVAAFTIGRRGR